MVSAVLTPGLTIHTQTFVDAANDAFESLPRDIQQQVKLEWACDEMSSLGGKIAAQKLLSQGVELVVDAADLAYAWQAGGKAET